MDINGCHGEFTHQSSASARECGWRWVCGGRVVGVAVIPAPLPTPPFCFIFFGWLDFFLSVLHALSLTFPFCLFQDEPVPVARSLSERIGGQRALRLSVHPLTARSAPGTTTIDKQSISTTRRNDCGSHWGVSMPPKGGLRAPHCAYQSVERRGAAKPRLGLPALALHRGG